MEALASQKNKIKERYKRLHAMRGYMRKGSRFQIKCVYKVSIE